jgi:hypothetical protein
MHNVIAIYSYIYIYIYIYIIWLVQLRLRYLCVPLMYVFTLSNTLFLKFRTLRSF